MLQGFIDIAGRSRFASWAHDTDWPEEPVSLLITTGTTLLLSTPVENQATCRRQNRPVQGGVF
jgi:hypothetical protein